jgi:hypothetical protein
VKYIGRDAIKRDTENLAAAARANGVEEAFMTAVSPATLQILPNAYYKSAEDYTWAIGACNDVLAANHLGETQDAIRHQFRMLQHVGGVADHPRG